MNEIAKLGGKLLLISGVAGLALGITNAVTSGPIAEQQILAANAARSAVLPSADGRFEEIKAASDALDDIYCGFNKADEKVGYTGKMTVKGYGGQIEVTVGMNMDGVIEGVDVGGSNFSETAGLGAKTKDAAFRDQFQGMDASQPDRIAVKADGGDVDAVSSATISSRAVSNGVRTICEELLTLVKEGA